VEIHGPAGAFPAGTQLRIFNSANGSVASTYALSGSIPGDGHWVIGDVGVPNVDSTSGFGGDDLPDGDPSGMQIYNTVTGCVYDSVIYEAFGGLDDLIRSSTLGVTDEGWPWLGETGPGTDSSGVAYTTGRMPDGADTDINSADFGVMVATPGTANGSGLTTPVTLNFTTAPSSAVQTFQSFAVSASGVGGSPSGGNVYRCLDTTGGGAMAFFGDAQLGAGTGINIQGEIYIPSGAEPAQAIGVGFCATQGDRFFSGANIDDASYENGYWLIYENAGGIGLNDGRPDHAGTFEFVHASNDNMDANRVDLLDSATTGTVGITPGAWTTFRLSINPPANPSEQLLAEINGVEIYRGVIPAGGPTVGAFAVGFRENHSGAPAANEGTWIDNIGFDTVNVVPVGLSLMGTN
jgi:hypothetical protein